MTGSYESRYITGGLEFRQSFDAQGRPEYLGEAQPGTTAAQGKWRISKIFYDVNGMQVLISWANGDSNFDKVWNSRGTYTYNAP